jgi:hypothetical protein
MVREKGKVPTNINKDMVASGETKNQTQIKNEGSNVEKNRSVLLARIEERARQEKMRENINPEKLKQKQIAVNQEMKQHQPKEFTKRIQNGHEK